MSVGVSVGFGGGGIVQVGDGGGVVGGGGGVVGVMGVSVDVGVNDGGGGGGVVGVMGVGVLVGEGGMGVFVGPPPPSSGVRVRVGDGT